LSPAASLHTGLLASKGAAQPSRGVAHPLIERLANTAPAKVTPTVAPQIINAPTVASTVAAGGRLSVRVDEKLQLRLRLASAHVGKNRQTILLEAIDHYLDKVLPTYLHDRCPCIEAGHGDGTCHQGKT
jgi:predicted DNA-binding protein